MALVATRSAQIPPPHHAEGVSSTRRGEGPGVGVSSRGASGFTPPLTPPRQGEGDLSSRPAELA